MYSPFQNSIRHNLSLHSFFLKAKRPSSLPGKGSYWSISPEGKENIMKEVMKHQQPNIRQNLNVEQSVAKGLRPILPKPADNLLIAGVSPFINNAATCTSSVEIMADARMNALPRSIPVVILPTPMYVNMANKIAAQAAAGNMAAVGVNPAFVSMATGSSSVENSGVVLGDQGSGERTQETDDTLFGKAAEEVNLGCTTSLSQIANEISQKNGLIEAVEQVLCKTKNKESQIISEGSGDSTVVSTNTRASCSNSEGNEGNEMLAPRAKKTRSDKRKAKALNRKTSTPSAQEKQNLPQPKRSPLRPRPQPTLAAINSQANELMTSPGCFFTRHNTSNLADISPVKSMITPTKACGNHSFLSSLLGSPPGSSNLCYSSYTPLNYGSDSGIFTPLKEGEMDFGFLFSPERFGNSKTCSTPQSCRKSLGLGLAGRVDEKKADSWYSGYDADFSKL